MALLPRFTRILARRPAPNFVDGLTTQELGAPDVELALQQYETYLQKLAELGLEMTVLDADPLYPDGHFVEDPLIVYRGMVFVCRSGAQERRGEAEGLLAHFDDHRIIHMDDANAFIDGGDVLFCADRVLIGLSKRTNSAGAEALKQALQSVTPDMRVDFVSFEGVLHLKSGLTELAPNVLVHDPAMTTGYDLSWSEVVSLPVAEGYAADVMPVNEAIFIVDGYPTLRALAEQHYKNVIALDMSEFQKMDGGLTCLSLRY